MRKLLLLLLSAPLLAQTQLPYHHVENWPQLPADYQPGAGMAVAVDAAGNVWYYNRGSHPVIQFSSEGKTLQAWKEDQKLSNHATSAHGMGVGVDGAIWLVGRETNRIFKLSSQGRILQVIGGFSGMQGDNSAKYAFNRPADVAQDSKGNTYIADGYRNTRVVKYGPSGDYITHWGGPGTAHGQLNLVHGVAVGPGDKIYVADRGNKRIQVFDSNGKFLAVWEGFGTPWALAYDKKANVVWACDGDAGHVIKLSMDGKLLGMFSTDGPAPGQLHQVHGIAVGQDGAIYVAETVNQRIQKFVAR
jgi:DNA-binding beta-propeller fold protein YncE